MYGQLREDSSDVNNSTVHNLFSLRVDNFLITLLNCESGVIYIHSSKYLKLRLRSVNNIFQHLPL